MQSWCRTWLLNGFNLVRAKQKLLRKPKGACKSSGSRIGSLKSSTLTIPRNLTKLVKIFPGIIVRRHQTDRKQMGLLREQYAEWKKVRLLYCCNQVWMRNGGQIPWNAFLICETFKISCLMRRHHTTDRSFRLVHWLSITLFFRKTSQESINLERKSYLDCSLDTLCTRGEFGRWHIGCRLWGVGNDGHSRNLLWKTQCERSNISKRKWNIHIPSRRWTHQHPRRRSGPENTHLDTSSNSRRKSRRFSWRTRRVSSTTSWLTSGEAKKYFWSMSGSFIYCHHVEPRVKLYSPREESFPVPLKYIDVSRTTHTNLDVKQEKRIDDYWNIDGSRDLSGSWTGFTQSTLSSEKPPEGHMWAGGRLTKWQATSRPDHSWPELWRGMSKNAKLSEKQKRAKEKTEDRSSWKITRNLFHRPWGQGIQRNHQECSQKNWKRRWLLLCLARQARSVSMERPVAKPMRSNQNLRVFWKSVIQKTAYGRISTESSWKSYCRKRWKFITALQFVSQIYSYASKLWKFRQRKQQWINNGRNKKRSGVGSDKSQK